ncbi:serine protease 55-like [Brevipalpus obovatus]|uniref:serine protease 55-like n=1 Tax=Brevipalpus obovatus TaxID=246614 RepID=UPI003D9F5265
MLIQCFALLSFLGSVLSHWQSCDCGLENPIANPSSLSKYPWLVLIQYDIPTGGRVSCAGTLISNQHIATSASCLYLGENGVRPDRLQVYLGPYSLTDLPIPVKVRNYFVHHLFKNDANYDRTGADIAFLTLDTELPRETMPICIANDGQNKPFSESPLKAIGWTGDGEYMASDPVEMNMNMISEYDCFSMRKGSGGLLKRLQFMLPIDSKYDVPQTDFCALNDSKSSIGCLWNSGAPLMWKNPKNHRWYLVGINSRGRSVCRDQMPKNPGMFTDVPKYFEQFSGRVTNEMPQFCPSSYDKLN